MNNEERKKEILKLLYDADGPLTGTSLAKRFDVTRQVIVQDIALLRAEKKSVIATARGYLLAKENADVVRKIVSVCHDAQSIEEELQIVVDLGGRVLTTFISHSVYGELGEALNIKSRRDIASFIKRISDTGCEPLLKLTKGMHKHMLEADTEEVMTEICSELNARGYLILD